MVPLDQPCAGAPVAAALQRHMPAPICERIEAIARGWCGGNAPARGRCARSRDVHAARQHVRCSVSGGCQVEPAALRKIEASLDRADDDGRFCFGA